MIAGALASCVSCELDREQGHELYLMRWVDGHGYYSATANPEGEP